VTIATLVLPFAAPNQNDLNRWQRSAAVQRGKRLVRRGKARGVFDDYGAMKAQWAVAVDAFARQQGIPAFESGAHVHFHIVEIDKRVDPDNLCSACAKFSLDALVKARVLPNDGWKHVHSLSFSWAVGARPAVHITLKSPDEP
jgi:hypothetical protein